MVSSIPIQGNTTVPVKNKIILSVCNGSLHIPWWCLEILQHDIVYLYFLSLLTCLVKYYIEGLFYAGLFYFCQTVSPAGNVLRGLARVIVCRWCRQNPHAKKDFPKKREEKGRRDCILPLTKLLTNTLACWHQKSSLIMIISATCFFPFLLLIWPSSLPLPILPLPLLSPIPLWFKVNRMIWEEPRLSAL